MALIKGTKKADYIDPTLITPGVNGGPATDAADHINGFAGDDEIHAGGGNDIMLGEAGNDRLFGDDGDDQVDGGDGHDHLWGGLGSDGLVGGAGNDRIDGGDGADRINGGRGNDVETGGGDADIFVISDGKDVVTDFSPTAHDVLIDFESVAGQGEILRVSEYAGLYAGLLWSDSFYAADNDASTFTGGFSNVLNSGEAAGSLNGRLGYASGTISSPDQDFDLVSGYFAAISLDGIGELDVTFEGIDDGQVVATLTVDNISEAKNFIEFGDDFLSVDTLKITAIQGVAGAGSSFLAMDDLTLRYYDGDGDLLQVASAAEINTLLASATTDGAGNTILSSGNNSTTLLGVDPTQVTADWFIIG